MTPVTVLKLDHEGRERFRYNGTVLERGPTWVRLEAYFNWSDKDMGFAVFREGDRFVELYDTERWYNICEIHDISDDHLKGWYCDFIRPPILDLDTISYADLALDLWVDPAGKILLLDEGEFAALPIDAATRSQVLRAADELRARVQRLEPPFTVIKSARQ
jgi:uncharacterized protein